MFYLSQLLQIIVDFSSPYLYICGDFNVNVLSHSRFGDELRRLYSDNLLCLSDTLHLPSDTFTFISSSHDTVSWLDHVLSTISGHSLFTNISVKSDFITSDHFSLCFVFQLIICMYRYYHLTVHHATNLIITGTEHPMSICLIISHTPELNLQKSSCLLMHYSVKM